MQIGIQRNILETIERLPDQQQAPEEIVISDNESEVDINEYEGIPVHPLAVTAHVGRGRHIRYRVLWSDNTETLRSKQDLVANMRWVLVEYQAKLNRERVARCRAKKQSEQM